ncbi:MAG: hypothetical protein J6Y82_00695 [Bacteroidales bacterium]|nr:hypothetical protein [Bacteroidales bacterium]
MVSDKYCPIIGYGALACPFYYGGFGYSDIHITNRAFIICQKANADEQWNIEDGDGRIVRYDATATENTGQVVIDQESLEAAIKTFCNQEDCDFDVIKYGDYVSGSDPWDIFYNYLELDGNNGFYMPMVRDIYAPKKNKDGRYIISEESGINAMANMMLNNTNGEKMYFQFGDEESRISGGVLNDLSFRQLDVPSGCTIDGCGGKYIEDFPDGGNYYLEPYVSGNYGSFRPVFDKIEGTVKRFVIELIKSNDAEEYSIDIVKAGDPGTTNPTYFGFLANSNTGTIESCSIISNDGLVVKAPTLEDYSDQSIGSFVGKNDGIIQNVTCGVYIELDHYGVISALNFGGIVGSNSGAISDVVFTGLSMAQQATVEYTVNGTFNSGLFVGENINGGTPEEPIKGTLKNAFLVLKNSDFVDAGDDFDQNQFASFAKVLDDDKVTIKSEGLEISSVDGDNKISLDSKEGFLYTRSDKGDITLLYVSGIINEVTDLVAGEGGNIPYKNILYSEWGDDITPEQASMSMTNFSEPIKWGLDGGIPSLSMSDINATNTTDPETQETVVNAVEIGNAEQLEVLVNAVNNYSAVMSTVNAKLTSDIEMSEYSSGSLQLSSFGGSLDGDNHKISGVRVNAYASETAVVPTPKEGAPEQMEELLVAQTEGIFGNLDETAVVKNIEIQALVRVSFDRDAVAGKKKIHVPLLAKKNKNRIKNVVLKAIIDTDTENLDEDATAQYTLVGDNSNESTDPEGQPVIENVVAYLPNSQLLYKSYSLLESEWNNNSSYYYSSITFEKAYFYWCNVANFTEARKDVIKMYGSLLLLRQLSDDDIVIPTFESFADWYMGLEGKPLESMTRIINANDLTDDEDIIELVCNFVLWYYANNDQQIARRAADKTVWATYNSSETSGNHVAVIATQNLCKSPGKGRTHKVCTAPAGGGNKDAELIMGDVCLNPDSKNEPKTEKYCSLETFPTEGAYWLNHEGESLTGNYGKMFSKGALYPILATNKSKPLVKLEYIVDAETKEQAEAHGLKFVSYANEGSNVQLSFTDRPAGIRVNGTLLDASAYSADHVSFTVPQTPEGVGKVSVLIGFDHIPTALEEIDATEPAEATGISVQGNTLTVSSVEGQQIEVTDLRGVRIAAVKAVGTQTRITIPNRGIYVVKVGTQATKVAIK